MGLCAGAFDITNRRRSGTHDQRCEDRLELIVLQRRQNKIARTKIIRSRIQITSGQPIRFDPIAGPAFSERSVPDREVRCWRSCSGLARDPRHECIPRDPPSLLVPKAPLLLSARGGRSAPDPSAFASRGKSLIFYERRFNCAGLGLLSSR